MSSSNGEDYCRFVLVFVVVVVVRGFVRGKSKRRKVIKKEEKLKRRKAIKEKKILKNAAEKNIRTGFVTKTRKEVGHAR